jgi:DNA-binding transcriptional MerR regulator/effector-binding domain-containing protein
MFSIGEFSKITGLSIKALRLYHERELLVPSVVDPSSGYRSYDFNNLERAQAVVILRQMMFGLDDIGQILANDADDGDVVSLLESHRSQIEGRIRGMKHVSRSLTKIIDAEKEARRLWQSTADEIEEKPLAAVLIAGIRIKGKYAECGPAFGKIGRSMGRFICGKPMNLFYDTDYKEEDADFESCFPVRASKAVPGIVVRELAGGKAVTLVHRGPYGRMGRSYARLLSRIHEKGYAVISPSREAYFKGPGLIFKGNPNRYVTEIQFLLRES